MSLPRASLGLVLLGLLSLAGWGCSKGPSTDDAKTGGEVKKSEDSDGPRDGRTGRVVGKVLRKMQADEKAEALGGPSSIRVRKYSTKTAAPRWETDASDSPFDRPRFKTEAKTFDLPVFKTQAKPIYKTDKTDRVKTVPPDKTEGDF
jgi:hypothetical protein